MGWTRLLPSLQSWFGIRRRVLFLEVFFPEASGYVYRVAKWASVLEAEGFSTRVRHPLGARLIGALLGGGWTGIFYALYLLRRLPQCLAAPLYNCVVVRRELLLYDDYGGLFLERLVEKYVWHGADCRGSEPGRQVHRGGNGLACHGTDRGGGLIRSITNRAAMLLRRKLRTQVAERLLAADKQPAFGRDCLG